MRTKTNLSPALFWQYTKQHRRHRTSSEQKSKRGRSNARLSRSLAPTEKAVFEVFPLHGSGRPAFIYCPICRACGVLHERKKKKKRISRCTRTAWAKTCLFLAVSGMALKNDFPYLWCASDKESPEEAGGGFSLTSWSCRSPGVLFLFANFLRW